MPGRHWTCFTCYSCGRIPKHLREVYVDDDAKTRCETCSYARWKRMKREAQA